MDSIKFAFIKKIINKKLENSFQKTFFAKQKCIKKDTILEKSKFEEICKIQKMNKGCFSFFILMINLMEYDYLMILKEKDVTYFQQKFQTPRGYDVLYRR